MIDFDAAVLDQKYRYESKHANRRFQAFSAMPKSDKAGSRIRFGIVGDVFRRLSEMAVPGTARIESAKGC